MTMPDEKTVLEAIALASDTAQEQKRMQRDMEAISKDYADLRNDLKETVCSMTDLKLTIAKFQGAGKLSLIGLGAVGTLAGIGAAAVGIWSKLK